MPKQVKSRNNPSSKSDNEVIVTLQNGSEVTVVVADNSKAHLNREHLRRLKSRLKKINNYQQNIALQSEHLSGSPKKKKSDKETLEAIKEKYNSFCLD